MLSVKQRRYSEAYGRIVKGIDIYELRGTDVELAENYLPGDFEFTFAPNSERMPLAGITFIFTGTGSIL